MASRAGQTCPQRPLTEALGADTLDHQARLVAQRHLEECTACRTLFRRTRRSALPRLRNYTLVERIGEGGFGVVYKAIHHAKQRTEALKVLFGTTAAREAYFQNEVHLIAKLRHPNIATLYDAHLGAPPLFYTMEFIEGVHLDEYLATRPVPLAERIRLVQTVARAIGYAHAHGVVHRDIKPQNILIDAQGQPHVVDFGIAKRLTPPISTARRAVEENEGFLGTFGYVAPEQMMGQEVDQRADVYALGALLFRVVTGEAAKLAARPEQVSRALHERQVVRASDLGAIILRCVQSVPEERYSSCAALAEDLERYLVGRAIEARTDVTSAYNVVRAVVYNMHHRPALVRAFLVITIGSLLAWLSYAADARWYQAGAPGPQTALVIAGPATLEAIRAGHVGSDLPGLDPQRRKSLRLLHGRMMERLAEARPGVVVWDGFFADCQPDYDPGLLRGFAALRAASVPVVIGTRDLDINAEPVVCPAIREAVTSVGVLVGVQPGYRKREWFVPICVRRAPAPLMPSLAVAAFAAARFPDADPQLDAQRHAVELRYRKRIAASGQPRWHEQVDRLPYAWEDVAGASDLLRAGDRVYPMHVPRALGPPALPKYAYEDVLAAPTSTLKQWFAGRAVVLGDAFPGRDEHEVRPGDRIFGCEVQAAAIEMLMGGASVTPLTPTWLSATAFIWALVGVGLGSVVRTNPRRPLRQLAWICVGIVVVALFTLTFAVLTIAEFWPVHAVLAVCGVLATAAPAYFASAVRRRQIELAPQPRWGEGGETVSTTLLATLDATPMSPSAAPESPSPAEADSPVPAGAIRSPTGSSDLA